MKLRKILFPVENNDAYRAAMAAIFCLAAACGFPRPADVPEPGACIANEFVACEGSTLQTCNAAGDATTTQDCSAAGCNAGAKRCNQCTPNSDSCGTRMNEIDHCGSDGLPASPETCQLGCVATPSPHCAYLEPRYLPDVCDTAATMPSFTVDDIANFDTSLDNNCNGGVVNQDGGPAICVVRYSSIDITTTGNLTVSGVRALALVADSAITIAGVLDVGGKGSANGPGGGTVRSGAEAGSSAGGGGAGFATMGAAGGSTTADGGGGLGGGQATDPSLVTVLIGGTGPNRGLPSTLPPLPGGGGGAATLIACRGVVSVTGTIDAGGGGGSGGGGGLTAQSKFSGTGGGSGGNVALQGLSIVVTGNVFANGGGGGAGEFRPTQGTVQAGFAGSDGTRSATESAPGGTPPGTAGAGGIGGRQGAGPGVGLHPSDATTGLPGGGGGSVGFFETYTPSGVTPQLTPSAASPTFSPNKQIKTR